MLHPHSLGDECRHGAVDIDRVDVQFVIETILTVIMWVYNIPLTASSSLYRVSNYCFFVCLDNTSRFNCLRTFDCGMNNLRSLTRLELQFFTHLYTGELCFKGRSAIKVQSSAFSPLFLDEFSARVEGSQLECGLLRDFPSDCAKEVIVHLWIGLWSLISGIIRIGGLGILLRKWYCVFGLHALKETLEAVSVRFTKKTNFFSLNFVREGNLWSVPSSQSPVCADRRTPSRPSAWTHTRTEEQSEFEALTWKDYVTNM